MISLAPKENQGAAKHRITASIEVRGATLSAEVTRLRATEVSADPDSVSISPIAESHSEGNASGSARKSPAPLSAVDRTSRGPSSMLRNDADVACHGQGTDGQPADVSGLRGPQDATPGSHTRRMNRFETRRDFLDEHVTTELDADVEALQIAFLGPTHVYGERLSSIDRKLQLSIY